MIADATSLLMALLSEQAMELLDEGARPLGERAIWGAYHSAGVDERPCPFHDSRQQAQLPINAAALRQVITAWEPMLATLNQLTGLCASTSPPEFALSAQRVWLTNTAAQCWPLLWARANPGQPVPLVISALFKVTLGFSTFLPMALLTHPGLAPRALIEELPPHACYELLDQEEWLWGIHQVCAGPPKHIMVFYQQLCTHDAARSPEMPHALPDALRQVAMLAQEFQAALLATGLAAQGFIERGQLELCPGYGGAVSAELVRQWPRCVRILELSPARTMRVIGALPELSLLHVERLFEPELARELFAQRLILFRAAGSLAEVDGLCVAWLQDLAERVAACLGVPSGASSLEEALDARLEALALELL